MSHIKTGFCTPLYSSLMGLFVIIFLTACQPLIHAQNGVQTKTTIIKTHQVQFTSDMTKQKTAPTSTALTLEDIAAKPPETEDKIGVQSAGQKEAQEQKKPSLKQSFSPADLVGRTHSYVNAQFGKADFKRTEGIIYVLQYHQPDCVIDFFINIADIQNSNPPADAKILGWIMRERIINYPLNQTLCYRQFYERKL